MTCIAIWVAAMVLGQQQGAATRVAVVNIPQISEQYVRTGDLERQFDEIRKKLNEERDALRDKVERTGRSLKEELKPGTDEFRTRQRELAMLEAQLQYFIDSEGKQIEQDLATSLRSIYDDIAGAIRAVAEERGIEVVLAADKLPEGGAENTTQVRQQIILQKVIYWNPRVDISADVIKRLNDSYKPATAPGGK